MARKPVLEGGKRDEIITAALNLFLRNGYENTSIRMILKEIGGEVGMFYHYYKSKEEVFEASMDHYFFEFSSSLETLIQKEKLNFLDKFYFIYSLLEKANSDFLALNTKGRVHWTIEAALRKRTILSLQKYVENMIEDAIDSDIAKNSYALSNQELATFILNGLEGAVNETILHSSANEAEIRKVQFIQLVADLLQIPQEMFNKKDDSKLNIPVWLL